MRNCEDCQYSTDAQEAKTKGVNSICEKCYNIKTGVHEYWETKTREQRLEESESMNYNAFAKTLGKFFYRKLSDIDLLKVLGEVINIFEERKHTVICIVSIKNEGVFTETSGANTTISGLLHYAHIQNELDMIKDLKGEKND